MHTALCAFDDHAAAERARDRLLQAGFARADVHLQRRGTSDPEGDTREDMLRHRGGVEHEIALSPEVVERVTGFFGHLFGRDHPRRGMWDDHVHGGRTVVVVDAQDEAEAERARTVLHEAQGSDVTRVHRPAQRPLRDILGATPWPAKGPWRPSAMATPRSAGWTERPAPADRPTAGSPEERAIASDDQRPLDLRVEGDTATRSACATPTSPTATSPAASATAWAAPARTSKGLPPLRTLPPSPSGRGLG